MNTNQELIAGFAEKVRADSKARAAARPTPRKTFETFGELLEPSERRIQRYRDGFYCPDLPRDPKAWQEKLKDERNKNYRSITEWIESPDGTRELYERLGAAWAVGKRIDAKEIPAEMLDWLICPDKRTPKLALIRVTDDGEIILLDNRKSLLEEAIPPPSVPSGLPSMPPSMVREIERALTDHDPTISGKEIQKAIQGKSGDAKAIEIVAAITGEKSYAIPQVSRIEKIRQRDETIRVVKPRQMYRDHRGNEFTSAVYERVEIPSRECEVCGTDISAKRKGTRFCSASCRAKEFRAT